MIDGRDILRLTTAYPGSFSLYTLRIYARLVPDALPGHAGGYFAKLCERPAYLATCEADASA